MATRTLGTAGTTTLTAILFNQSPNVVLPADMATVKNGIKDDLNASSVSPNSFFDYNGLLMIPRRGLVRVLPGDFVAFDATGWPILLSATAAANANWVHT